MMFFLHDLFLDLGCLFARIYYKLIYGKHFIHGKSFLTRGGFKLYIEKTGSVRIGDDCFLNRGFSANAMESISIGNHCIFGENVKVYDHNHVFDDSEQPVQNQGYSVRPVVIENGCWIGSNVTILAGTHIGKNCIIGANCLVYRDIPEKSVVKHGESLIITPRI